MKRIVTFAAFAVFASLALTKTNVLAAQIRDIGGHWAEQAIIESVNSGYISGYADGSFKPDAPVTRAEFIVVMNRFSGVAAANTSYAKFFDVGEGDWFFADVVTAAGLGNVSGYADGTFRPKALVTREAAAAITAKYMKLAENHEFADYFSDCGSLTWSRGSIGAAVKAGAISGYTDGTFKPFGTLTRAEAVALAKRAGELKESGVSQQSGAAVRADYYDSTYIPEDRLNYQSTNVSETTTPAKDGYYKIYNWNYGKAGDEPERFNGNVHYDPVSAGTVRNIFVTGDFLVSSFTSPDSELTLIDVEIRGKLVIYGVRDVELINCYIDKIEYRSETSNTYMGVVTVDADSVVNETTAFSGVNLLEDTFSSRGFRNVVMASSLRSGAVVTMSGDFNKIDVDGRQARLVVDDGITDEIEIVKESDNSKVEVKKGASVASLSIYASALIEGEGVVERASVNAEDVRLSLTPKKIVGSVNPEYVGAEKKYSITITAMDSAGDLLTGASITLSGHNEIVVGNDGTALFDELSPGSYDYEAEYGGETRTGTITITDGDIYREIIFS